MNLMQPTYDKYTFFWRGPFSQWHRCTFVIDGLRYSSAEQYMMFRKAELFGDARAALKIMETDECDRQKFIGRLVQGFDANTWNAVARDVVLRGSLAKYSQNPHLLKQLLETAGTLLVEASPADEIWGIGLTADVAATVPPEKWPGTNWLGLVLTEVREALSLRSSASQE